jgi:ubiquinone/menaquinone biosynthesis C-methylase UbiE
MRWLRKSNEEPLAVSMSGIKLGDRLLVVGGADVALITALAGKAGLTGRACVVDESEAVRARTAAAVEREGVLVETFTAPPNALPFEGDAFDAIVIRNVLPSVSAEARPRVLQEVQRVARPGGRCIVIDDGRRGGLAGLMGGGGTAANYGEGGAAALLTAAGFRGVRTLAEREGLVFVEGVKPGLGG